MKSYNRCIIGWVNIYVISVANLTEHSAKPLGSYFGRTATTLQQILLKKKELKE